MRGFLIAVTFLTRMPFPPLENVTSDEFTTSQRYYPLVGMLLGIILSVSALLLSHIYSPLIGAALLLIEELIVTGGIHMDGFMDSMDALWSARTPERMLEIMKDSRVGSFGALSACALLLLKWSLFAELLLPSKTFSWHENAPFLVLFTLPIVSRWVFLLGILFFPYARKNGLGQGFHESSLQRPWFFYIEGFLCLALAVLLLGWAGLVGFFCSFLFTAYFTRKTARLLGGLTGDLYGASIELAEVFFLLGTLPFFVS